VSGDAGASELELRLVPRLRLVRYAFEKTYGSEPAGVWQAPGALVLLGGRPGGRALAVPVRWSAAVAGAPRGDRLLVVGSLNRPAEPVCLDLEVPDGGALPGWAGPVRAVAEALREAGHLTGGATLMLNADVPETAGVASLEALRCGTALALTSLSGGAPSRGALLAALGDAGDQMPARVASLLGRPGHALVIEPPVVEGSPPAPGPGPEPVHIPFEPAAAGLRLVLIALRPGDGGPVPRWQPDASDDARVDQAAGLLRAADPAELGPGLGALLTASHRACPGAGTAPEAELAVQSAIRSGALGARATSARGVLALVGAPSLRAVRGAVAQAFRARGLPVPRFLTTAACWPKADQDLGGLSWTGV